MNVDVKIIADVIRSITIVSDDTNLDALCETINTNESHTVVSFINAHALNLAFKNEKFAACLTNSDFLFRDGIGMEILLKFLKKDPGFNMNGTDFIPFFLQKNKGKRIALLGTQDPYLTNAVRILKSEGHNIVTSKDGFSNQEEYIALIQGAKPEIIILGMGMPRQELLGNQLKDCVSDKIIWINGGAIIDFIGGKIERAPRSIQKLKLEWAYRLFREPKRLFHRYVIGNAVFLSRLSMIRKEFC